MRFFKLFYVLRKIARKCRIFSMLKSIQAFLRFLAVFAQKMAKTVEKNKNKREKLFCC